MSKFIALPVGQGDAFYLERPDFRVLVDGGKSKTAISPWMTDICRTKYLDVLVCTHNDIDHANGVVGLLENWSGTVSEVWLPGSWTHRMEDLFVDPHGFCGELIDNICKYEKDKIPASLEEIAKLAVDKDSHEETTLDEDSHEETTLGDIVEASKKFPSSLFEICLGCPHFEPLFFHCLHKLHDKHRNLLPLFWECIESAKNIRAITELAYQRGCKIRFFEFGTEIFGGFEKKLEPVNSTEMASITSRKVDAVDFLALSVANEKSLVFISPENDNNPAVLFTADSNLGFSLPSDQPNTSPIVTSPHHGSENNKKAYSVISEWLAPSKIDSIWIRSDCKSTSRPGTSFINLPNKLCTLCSCGTHPKQIVKLHSKQGRWQLTRGTRRCSCA